MNRREIRAKFIRFQEGIISLRYRKTLIQDIVFALIAGSFLASSVSIFLFGTIAWMISYGTLIIVWFIMLVIFTIFSYFLLREN